VREEIEEGGERRRLTRMRLLCGDRERAMRLEDHSAQRGGPLVHVARLKELGDRHRDRRFPIPAPPPDGNVVVARRLRLLDKGLTSILQRFGSSAEPSTLLSSLR